MKHPSSISIPKLGLLIMILANFSAHAATDNIAPMLEEIRAKHKLPALAAAAFIDGQVVALGTTGTRKVGGREKVTDDDLWHIGSDGKSMTASLAAVLVQDGKIKWETTVAEVFPAFRGRMNDAWKAVTLEQLLTNRSGAPSDPPEDLWQTAWKQSGSPASQRMDFVRGLVERAPEAPPGTKFIYSNQGYTIAGAMLEKAAGKPFEKLMTERLFVPLGLKTAGFGAPGDPRRVDQPWGHTGSGTSLVPVPPGPTADNPPAVTPAGRVHLSIADFARYAAWHAGGAAKNGKMLTEASFAKLHTPPPGADYAMGWGIGEFSGSGGKVLMHEGSNTMWLAVIWVVPAKNSAFVVATNSVGTEAEQGTEEVILSLIKKLLP